MLALVLLLAIVCAAVQIPAATRGIRAVVRLRVMEFQAAGRSAKRDGDGPIADPMARPANENNDETFWTRGL
jgi:hypothetical protein